MSKSTIRSVKLVLVIKLLAIIVAFLVAPKLMATTFFCFFGLGKTLSNELQPGAQRFGWILFTFVFLCLAGCVIQGAFPSLGYTTTDMLIISGVWTFVFGVPLDICNTPLLDIGRHEVSTTALVKKDPVVVDAEIVE
jgi:hypothetical protein